MLGRLENSFYSPIFYAKSLVGDAFGCLLGICLLIAAVLETAVLLRSLGKQL
jgi:hypothetical protein